MEHISIDDFKKVEARVGTVMVAEAVPDSDKLIRFEIDFGGESSDGGNGEADGGTERRQILSAIREWYPDPSQLVGKQLLFCTNLAPRMIRGLESNGMLMAVDGIIGTDGTATAPIFLVPAAPVPNGSAMR